MRLLALFVMLAVACDHRPPSKHDQAASAGAAKADVSAPPPGDDACLQTGAKIAEIIIAATTDATQRAAYEQERTKLVKRFSENCRTEQWPEATRRCFLAATTASEIEVCSRDLVKAAPAAAGSGSATGVQ